MKQRIAYEALFNYHGKTVYNNRPVAGASVYLEFSILYGNEEIYITSGEESIDISNANIELRGKAVNKIELVDLITVSADKDNGYRITENSLAAEIRRKGYSFTYKPYCYTIDLYNDDTKLWREPFEVSEEEYHNFIIANYAGFDETDNNSAQCTSYILIPTIEINKSL